MSRASSAADTLAKTYTACDSYFFITPTKGSSVVSGATLPTVDVGASQGSTRSARSGSGLRPRYPFGRDSNGVSAHNDNQASSFSAGISEADAEKTHTDQDGASTSIYHSASSLDRTPDLRVSHVLTREKPNLLFTTRLLVEDTVSALKLEPGDDSDFIEYKVKNSLGTDPRLSYRVNRGRIKFLYCDDLEIASKCFEGGKKFLGEEWAAIEFEDKD